MSVQTMADMIRVQRDIVAGRRCQYCLQEVGPIGPGHTVVCGPCKEPGFSDDTPRIIIVDRNKTVAFAEPQDPNTWS